MQALMSAIAVDTDISQYLRPVDTMIFGIPKSSVYFILGLLFGYPVSYIFTRYLQRQTVSVSFRHFFLTITGLLAGIFVFGYGMLVLLLATTVTYIILAISMWIPYLKVRFAITLLLCIFNFGYLLYFYYIYQGDNYGLDFTLGLCLLSLRYIGISIDIYDGFKVSSGKETLEATPKALVNLPPLVEFLSYTYSIFGFFVGPIISFTDYNEFVGRDYGEVADKLISAHSGEIKTLRQVNAYYNKQSLKLFGGFLIYIILNQAGAFYFPLSSLYDPSFIERSSFGWRMVVQYISPKCAMMKYFAVWLLMESIGCLSQFVYIGPSGYKKHSSLTSIYSETDDVGQSADGSKLYYDCQLTNILPWRAETASTMKRMISGFNIKTNAWAKYYLFKRFKCFGSKNFSSAITLIILCVWHGFHFGYYHSFAVEYILILMADYQDKVVANSNIFKVCMIFWFQIVLYFMSIAFNVNTAERFWTVMKSTFFVHHISVAVAFLYFFVASKLLVSATKSKKTKSS